MANVNDSYFDGQYKEIWRQLIPEELTSKEVGFMIDYFKLLPGDNVLDLMCGFGRHAIALAKKGMNITAIDNQADYISEIKSTANREQLPVQAFKADIIKFQAVETYKLAICMGNSLNFFPHEQIKQLLVNTSNATYLNGFLVINTWSLSEITQDNFERKHESTINHFKFINESKYFPSPARIETESQIIDVKGNIERRKAIDYIISINDIDTYLTEAGYQIEDIFSIPGKKKFTKGDPRAYIIAKKVRSLKK
jgi:cyclopropane fatty-acyl-phospholipid synthase-like methyltransferase